MDAARYAALFLSESREHLTEVDDALLALERDHATTLINGTHLATVFRGVHTIKGMAAAMGYTAVEQLSHALESRCEPLRRGAEPLSAEVLARCMVVVTGHQVVVTVPAHTEPWTQVRSLIAAKNST